MLLVLTKSRILQALCARRGQTQRLIEFSIRQQPGIGGNLASQGLAEPSNLLSFLRLDVRRSFHGFGRSPVKG